MKTLFHHNIEDLTSKRKSLRNNSTNAEILLWGRLKNNQLGVKFRRQHSVDYYILDFYCPKFKLGIELDGSVHRERNEYDELRTKYIEAFNIKILRFWNSEIENQLESVISKIKGFIPS